MAVKIIKRHDLNIRTEIAKLGKQEVESFRGTPERVVLGAGSVVYRYGSTADQARTTRGEWLYVTPQCFETSEEAIDFLALLDVTLTDTGERDGTGAIPGTCPECKRQYVGGHRCPRCGTKLERKAPAASSWNSAAYRADMQAAVDLVVWMGEAAGMAFDLAEGKRYRGPGDMMPHTTRQGGAQQILVHKKAFDLLRLLRTPIQLRRAQQLH